MLDLSHAPCSPALRDSLRNVLAGRTAQTLLLCGQDSHALAQVARILAAGLLCSASQHPPCGQCTSCRKVEQGIHTDLLLLDEGEEEIKVDTIRGLKTQNYLVPTEGERRVTIVHHAHHLNVPAQNALLKLLEEPPGFAFFILTTEQPDVLLPTVRSRCTRFLLAPTKQSDIPDEQALAHLRPYLDALSLGNEIALLRAAMAMEKIPRRTLLAWTTMLQQVVRDAILCVYALGVPPLVGALKAQSTALATHIAVPRLLALYDFLHRLTDSLQRNLGASALVCALSAEVYALCFVPSHDTSEYHALSANPSLSFPYPIEGGCR